MRIHIMGIAGTLMTSIAQLAVAIGHDVTGSEQGPIYPPMSTTLDRLGLKIQTPYQPDNLIPFPDYVIIGNGIKRGNPELEFLLDQNIPYISGPQWLHDTILSQRQVIVVSGTHGKTTTTTMVVSILRHSGLEPGYLIGGMPQNLPTSAALGQSPFFVIEGDEYDTAFFDKRSKFLHYHPFIFIINNLEFDHADIFDDLAAIQKQFHQGIRIIPASGTVIYPAHDPVIQAVLDRGIWTPQQTIGLRGSGASLEAELMQSDGGRFAVFYEGEIQGEVQWALTGTHNVMNALSALLASHRVGVAFPVGIQALCTFQPPARRMEKIAEVNGITVFDDFAHHPTAIQTMLKGLRDKIGSHPRIIVFLEMKSYTMRSNVHGSRVIDALQSADQVYILKPNEISEMELRALSESHRDPCVSGSAESLWQSFLKRAQSGDHVVIMSNGDFQGLRAKVKMQAYE